MESQMRINPAIMDIKMTSRRHADIGSHPGHYRVAPYTSSWSQKGHSHGHEWPPIVHCPPIPEIGLFQNLTLKIEGQGHSQGQTRWLHLLLRIQSKRLLFISWQLDHIWLRTWGMANFIFDRENFRSRPWPRSNLIVTFRVQTECLHFVLWPSDHLWLRYSKFRIWPWKFNSRSRSRRKSTKI